MADDVALLLTIKALDSGVSAAFKQISAQAVEMEAKIKAAAAETTAALQAQRAEMDKSAVSFNNSSVAAQKHATALEGDAQKSQALTSSSANLANAQTAVAGAHDKASTSATRNAASLDSAAKSSGALATDSANLAGALGTVESAHTKTATAATSAATAEGKVSSSAKTVAADAANAAAAVGGMGTAHEKTAVSAAKDATATEAADTKAKGLMGTMANAAASVLGFGGAQEKAGASTKTAGDAAEKAAGSVKNVDGAAKNTVGSLSGMAQGMLSGSTAAGPLAMGLAAAGAALVGIVAITAPAAEAFQKSQQQMQNTADISSKAASSIGTAFLATAGQVEFSAQQMMAAYGPVSGQLAEVAGHALSTKDAMQFMSAATDLAEASGNNLDSTTKDLANTMKIFHLNTQDAAGAADVLYNASNKSGVGLDQLQSTIMRLGVALQGSGVTVQQMGGLFLDLTDKVGSGRKAIMSIGSDLQSLVEPTSKAQAAIEGAGLSFKNAQGQFIGVGPALQQLKGYIDGTAGASTAAAQAQYKSSVAVGIFGGSAADAVPKFDALTKQLEGASSATQYHTILTDTFGKSAGAVDKVIKGYNMRLDENGSASSRSAILTDLFGKNAKEMQAVIEGGQAGLDKYTKSVDAQGSAAKGAAAASDTFKGNQEKLSAAFKNAEVVVGNLLLPVLTELMKLLVEILGPLVGFTAAHEHLISTIIKVASVMVALGTVIGGVILFHQQLGHAAENVGHAFENVGHAIENVVHAFENVGHAFGNVFNALSHAWDAIPATWNAAWTNIGNALKQIWSGLKVAADVIFSGMSTAIMATWNALRSAATTVWNAISATITNVWNTIQSVTVAVWNAIFSFFGTNWGQVKALATTVFGEIQTVITTVWNALLTASNATWNAIMATISGVWNTLLVIATSTWNAISTTIQTIWNALQVAASAIWNAISQTIQGVWNTLLAVGTAIWNTISTVIQTIWNALLNAAKLIFTTMQNTIQGIWNNIQAAATTMWNAISNTVSGIWNTLKATAQIVFTGIQNVIQGVWDNIHSAAITMWNAIVSGISSAWNAVKKVVADPINVVINVVNAFTGGAAKVLDIVGVHALDGAHIPNVSFASGGVLPGYGPGVDSVHAYLSPGEGILTPQATRGIGGKAAIDAINASFARGGVVESIPHFDAGGIVSGGVSSGVFHGAWKDSVNGITYQDTNPSGGHFVDAATLTSYVNGSASPVSGPSGASQIGGAVATAAGAVAGAAKTVAGIPGLVVSALAGLGKVFIQGALIAAASVALAPLKAAVGALPDSPLAAAAGKGAANMAVNGIFSFISQKDQELGVAPVASGNGVTGSVSVAQEAAALAYAISHFSGLPYTWGNNDCSGIVQKSYAAQGVSLPRVSSAQWGASVAVSESTAVPGDLAFYNPGTSGAPAGLPGHVGFYVSPGKIFDAYNTSRPIGYDPLSLPGNTFMGIRRPGGVAGAGTAPGGNVATWIAAAEAAEGWPSSWSSAINTIIMRESGGNPNAINLTDSNAKAGDPSRGLMQTIMTTFMAYRDPKLSSNIYDPVANIVAAVRYILARYGSVAAVASRPGGYAVGAWDTGYQAHMAEIHPREMIIPAGPASAIRSGGFGGHTHITNHHHHWNFDGCTIMDDRSMRSFVDKIDKYFVQKHLGSAGVNMRS